MGAAGVRYRIRREPYRGSANRVAEHRPDVIVIQVTVPQQGQGLEVGRDILWVECKASSENKPNGWNKVMEEAVDRLSVAHPTRNIHLILAIGIEWMMFEWDPTNLQSPLQILAHNQAHAWDVDPRIHPLPFAGTSFLLQSRQNGPLDLIDTTRACSLNFWVMDPTGQHPLNMPALLRLEACLAHVQAAAYIGGPNPAHFPL